MLSKKKLDKIIEKNKGCLEALEEFDRTKKMVSKVRLNFTIDRHVAKQFRDKCKNLNKSQIVEDLIRKIINDENKQLKDDIAFAIKTEEELKRI